GFFWCSTYLKIYIVSLFYPSDILSCYKFQKREHCIGGIDEGWKEFSFLVETSSFCREEYGSCTCF
ncbi:hypothetical protein NMW28_26725, partial [Escherichia coli]|uniref:hypothetical protein n=1 Tax=Escherichia coli TaxID=562 RepID=UPI002247B99A